MSRRNVTEATAAALTEAARAMHFRVHACRAAGRAGGVCSVSTTQCGGGAAHCTQVYIAWG